MNLLESTGSTAKKLLQERAPKPKVFAPLQKAPLQSQYLKTIQVQNISPKH